MRRIRWIVLAAVLGVCSLTIASAEQKPPTALWDDAATREVRQVIDKGMDAIAAMDSAWVSVAMGKDVSGFDIDVEGKPVRMGSRDEAVRYFNDIFAWAKKAGARLRFDRHSTDCHAISALAFCALEYDFVATMPDGSTLSQPTRTTVVLRRGDDGWKWVHWHSSLSTLPAPPATSGWGKKWLRLLA
ncbi:MAG: nuclear transport factor 2 family protein [candidate division Zixibacteria bacterium]|nr:nuclear transport factor 2 family protein [candidate division Zixibacteria bacterium]